jgi:methylmalonyl-CoA carboxyltransferase large subunit
MATEKPTATGSPQTSSLSQALAVLQAQLASLAERLDRLEGRAAATLPPAPAPAPAPAQKIDAPGISEEEVLAVSAALAAYLGVRLRIRQIRLLGSPAWAQQGRVSIQASHRLHS